MTDSWLFRAEVSLIVGAAVAVVLWALMLTLDRRGYYTASYRLPVATGFGLRLIAVAVAAAVPAIGHKLTSTDETAFLATTKALAALPFSDSRWMSMTVHWTEVIPWALTYKVFGNCGPLPLRLEQIGLSLVAVIGVSSVSGRLGGCRAGIIAAWIAALEPSSIYFAGLLHQESLCMVGEALLLAALVGAWTAEWRGLTDSRFWRLTAAGLVGLALIFGTRSYMTFFAGVAVVLVLAGAVLCRRVGPARALTALTAAAVLVALAGVIAAPHVVPSSLANLQHQLNLNYSGANLPLPHATVTSASGLLKTIVARSVDLALRPFPWQLGSAAQKVAVLGTLVWYVLVAVALILMIRRGLDQRLVPVAILAICETIGFSLTLVDTGEGFRHRINLIMMLAVALGVLVDRWLSARGQATRETDDSAAKELPPR
jgi:hypothetical protein